MVEKWRGIDWKWKRVAHGFERERKKTCAENSLERKKMNSTKAHESGLPDFLTGWPVIGQKREEPKTVCRIWDPVDRIWTREQQARIRLAGFVIRLAGYWPESEKHEFGLPVCLNGWPVSGSLKNNRFSGCLEPEIRFCSSKFSKQIRIFKILSKK